MRRYCVAIVLLLCRYCVAIVLLMCARMVDPLEQVVNSCQGLLQGAALASLLHLARGPQAHILKSALIVPT
jgi:hypothetical protein